MEFQLRRPRPPSAFFAYLMGIALLVGLSFAPSSVHTSYSVAGTALFFGLFVGLGFGSAACRLLLIFLGLVGGVGTFLLQSGSLDPITTAWSVIALLVTAILWSPSMRAYTHH